MMDNFSSICRTCLNQNEANHLVAIESVYLLSGTVSLMEVLMKYTAIENNECYPPNICTQCLIKADEASCFFEKCNESDSLLRQVTNNVVENDENDNVNNNITEMDFDQEISNCEIITIKNEDKGEMQIRIVFDDDSSPNWFEETEGSGETEQSDNEKFSIDHEGSLTATNYFPLEKCKFCYMEFQIEEFQEHKLTLGHFDNSKALVCPHCHITCRNITTFKEHIRTHNFKEMRKYVCKLCKKVFKWKKNYLEHVRLHDTSKEEKVMCPECGLLLSNMTTLQIHRGKEHAKVLAVSEWKCSYCLNVFDNIMDFKKHMKEIHFAKDFHCVICGMDCKDKRTLYYHEQLHLDDFGIECSYCHKKLLTEEKLILHQRIHKYVKKKHVCDICNKGFKQLDKLEAHIRVHTGEKPFTCNFCGKAFNHQNNLWHHSRLHTGDTPYKCLFCSKEFSNSHSLKKHMNTHDNVKIEESLST